MLAFILRAVMQIMPLQAPCGICQHFRMLPVFLLLRALLQLDSVNIARVRQKDAGNPKSRSVGIDPLQQKPSRRLLHSDGIVGNALRHKIRNPKHNVIHFFFLWIPN